MITGEFKLLKQGDPARQKLRFLFMTPNPLQVKYKRQTSQSQTVHSIYKREKELDKGHFSPRAASQCWLSSTPTPPNKLSGTGDWPSSGLFTSLISRGKPPYNGSAVILQTWYLYNRGLDTTAFFPPCEDIARNPFSKPGGGLSPEPSPPGTLVLDFQLPELGVTNLCCLSPVACVMFLQQPCCYGGHAVTAAKA